MARGPGSAENKHTELVKHTIQSELCLLPHDAQPSLGHQETFQVTSLVLHPAEGLWEIRAPVRGPGLCESSEEGHRSQEPRLGRLLGRLRDGSAEKGVCAGSY